MNLNLTPEQKANGMIVRNAVRCRICSAPADRYVNRFECQANPAHTGDLFAGVFIDRTFHVNFR